MRIAECPPTRWVLAWLIASSVGAWLSFEIAEAARQRAAERAWRAQEDKRRAEAVAQGVHEAEAAKHKLDRIAKELDELDTKIERAVDLVVNAENDRDRSVAKARLVALQQEQYEIKQRYVAARAVVTGASPVHVIISINCLHNVLADDCLGRRGASAHGSLQ